MIMRNLRWLARVEWCDVTADALLLGGFYSAFVVGNDHVAIQCLLMAALNLSLKRGHGFMRDRWTSSSRRCGA